MELNEILSALLQAVLLAAIPFLVALVRLGLQRLVELLKSKTNSEQFALLLTLAASAVSAAEQSGLAAKVAGLAFDKKEYAKSYMQSAMERYGITISLDEIEVMIESEVLRQFNFTKALE